MDRLIANLAKLKARYIERVKVEQFDENIGQLPNIHQTANKSKKRLKQI